MAYLQDYMNPRDDWFSPRPPQSLGQMSAAQAFGQPTTYRPAGPTTSQPPTGGVTGMGGTGATVRPQTQPFNQAALMAYLKTLPANPDSLRSAYQQRPDLFGRGAILEDSDEVWIPGVGRVDLGVAFEGGDPSRMRWAWQTGATPGGGVPGQFSDPYTKQLEAIARTRIEQLFKPLSSGRDRLSMIDQARRRVAELQGPGFTTQQRELLQSQVAEPTEALRAASRQRALERASARGFAPSSGLTEMDMRDIDTAADRQRAESQRALSLEEINRQEQKKAESMELQKYLSDAETARQLLQEGRYAEALSIAEGMSRLPERRLASAQSALGSLQGGVGGTDPLSALMQMFGYNQQQNLANQQRNQNWLFGLGELATRIPWGSLFGGAGGGVGGFGTSTMEIPGR